MLLLAQRGAALISIHAPAKGATASVAMFAPPTYIISIHAPAKGATVRDTAAAASESFQSTLPRRERHKYNLEMFAERIFQSTLPRRERHKVTFCYIAHAYFNPRSREGSDLPISPFGGDLSHFNPRSREGSDCNHRIPNAPCVQFQSTLPRRERQFQLIIVSYLHHISIHAPAKGATSAARCIACKVDISIHAPAKGATLFATAWAREFAFQSTLPRRERQNSIFEVRGTS